MTVIEKLKDLAKSSRSAPSPANANVEKIRARRLDAQKEMQRIAAMAVPSETMLEALDRDLDSLEANARRDFYGPSLTHSKNPRLDPMRPEVMLGLLVAACRGKFREVIVQEISPHFEAGDELTLPEREAQLAKIADELDELERIEETIIREAEANGLPILRRADADPDTLLLADASLGL